MSKSIKQVLKSFFCGPGTNSFGVCGPPPHYQSHADHAQGNTGFNFIVLIIIIALIWIFTSYLLPLLGCRISAPESAGTSSPAGSILKLTARTGNSSPDATQNTMARIFSLNNLSCGPSFPQDRGNNISNLRFEISDALIEKLLIIESGKQLNPPDGDDGQAVGPLQLHLCVLQDVSKYYDIYLEPDDRKNLTKAKLIAKVYITMWLIKNQEEIAVRIFNGGPRGWTSTSTEAYWEKYLKLKNED